MTMCTRGAQNCLVSFKNTVFSNNRALRRGGAYYYPWVRPEFQNLSFSNNMAPYGNNIASYPIKFTVNKTEPITSVILKDLVSG